MRKKAKQPNAVEELLEMADCDAAMCESFGEEGLVAVSPYDTRTGRWVNGLTLVTSWEEVFEANCDKVCQKKDRIAREKLEGGIYV